MLVALAILRWYLCVLQHPISWLVQEMDSIQVEQKVVSCVSEKAKWWEGRRALDSRVEVSVEETRDLLGSHNNCINYSPLFTSTQTHSQRKHDTVRILLFKF